MVSGPGYTVEVVSEDTLTPHLMSQSGEIKGRLAAPDSVQIRLDRPFLRSTTFPWQMHETACASKDIRSWLWSQDARGMPAQALGMGPGLGCEYPLASSQIRQLFPGPLQFDMDGATLRAQ